MNSIGGFSFICDLTVELKTANDQINGLNTISSYSLLSFTKLIINVLINDKMTNDLMTQITAPLSENPQPLRKRTCWGQCTFSWRH